MLDRPSGLLALPEISLTSEYVWSLFAQHNHHPTVPDQGERASVRARVLTTS